MDRIARFSKNMGFGNGTNVKQARFYESFDGIFRRAGGLRNERNALHLVSA